MKTRGYKQLTQKDFDLIKLLQSNGLSRKNIQSITKRGHGTIWAIGKVDTLEEYKALVKKNNTPREVVEVTDEQAETHFTTLSVYETRMLNVLEELVTATNRLADAWEKTPEKKGWLK